MLVRFQQGAPDKSKKCVFMSKKKNKGFNALPKSVRILSNIYKILPKPDLRHSPDGDEVHGYCECGFEKTIYLRENTNANVAEVLMHEILHAIWYEHGFKDFKKISEEQMVNGLGIALTCVMQDNPSLVKYFQIQWKDFVK